MTEIERQDTDILILGSGGAGLFAALHAQRTAPELKITLAVKGLIGKCGCTRMVQGGYNVALGGGDTVERHFMDTIIGGKWLPDQDMACGFVIWLLNGLPSWKMRWDAFLIAIRMAACIKRPLPDKPQTEPFTRAI